MAVRPLQRLEGRRPSVGHGPEAGKSHLPVLSVCVYSSSPFCGPGPGCLAWPGTHPSPPLQTKETETPINVTWGKVTELESGRVKD